VVTDSYGVVDYDTTSAFILQTIYQSKSINYTALAGDQALVELDELEYLSSTE
jgi:hypothetical protein